MENCESQIFLIHIYYVPRAHDLRSNAGNRLMLKRRVPTSAAPDDDGKFCMTMIETL